MIDDGIGGRTSGEGCKTRCEAEVLGIVDALYEGVGELPEDGGAVELAPYVVAYEILAEDMAAVAGCRAVERENRGGVSAAAVFGVCAFDNVGLFALHDAHEGGYGIGRENVVAVCNDEERRPDVTDEVEACGSQPHVRRVAYHSDTGTAFGMLCCDVVEDGYGVVGRAVVAEDILDVGICLAEQGGGAVGDVCRHVIDGDDNGDALRAGCDMVRKTGAGRRREGL